MSAPSPTPLDRYRGCLLGGAAGDALGAAVEFLSLDEIRRRFGAQGILDPAEAYGRIGAITDDTQMTLFTAEGLMQAADRLDRGVGHPANQLWAAYQRWLATQGERTPAGPDMGWVWRGELHHHRALHSRRGPGTTCLTALRVEHSDGGWQRIAANDSKGCGGVMRAAPCGLVGDACGQDGPARAAVVAAGITHGHPSGYLAAGALAAIVDRLARADPLDTACEHALRWLEGQEQADEVARAMTAAIDLAEAGDGAGPGIPPALGEGWVAEEALAIALYCVLRHPRDFAAAARLAANHSGDSDSTAAIAGNLAGTLLGLDAIPAAWLDALELREEIDRLAVALYRRFAERTRDLDWDVWRSDGAAT